jgi:sugar lactone lactonase YvrE
MQHFAVQNFSASGHLKAFILYAICFLSGSSRVYSGGSWPSLFGDRLHTERSPIYESGRSSLIDSLVISGSTPPYNFTVEWNFTIPTFYKCWDRWSCHVEYKGTPVTDSLGIVIFLTETGRLIEINGTSGDIIKNVSSLGLAYQYYILYEERYLVSFFETDRSIAFFDRLTNNITIKTLGHQNNGWQGIDVIAAFNDIAYGGGYATNQALSAYNISSGHVLWTFPRDVRSAPVIDSNGFIYVTAMFGSNAHKLNAKTGAVIWSGIGENTAVGAGALDESSHIYYFAGHYGGVTALNMTTGSLIWGPSGQNNIYYITIGDGVIFAGTLNINGGYVEALNSRTGARLWLTQPLGVDCTDCTSNSPLILLNPSILLAHFNSFGYLVALRTSDGAILAKTEGIGSWQGFQGPLSMTKEGLILAWKGQTLHALSLRMAFSTTPEIPSNTPSVTPSASNIGPNIYPSRTPSRSFSASITPTISTTPSISQSRLLSSSNSSIFTSSSSLSSYIYTSLVGIPNDTCYNFSGSKAEDISSFSIIQNNTGGILQSSNATSFPTNILTLSRESYLSRSISSLSSSLPIGSSPFTVSSWVKCDASLLTDTNPSSVAIAWGESSSSGTLLNTAATLSANDQIKQATVTTIAGRGFGQFIDDGTSPDGFPNRIASDSLGNIYECTQNRIRKITPQGKVTFFVGNGNPGTTDGIGTSATINYCNGVTVDSSNTVYVLQTSAYRNVRKITLAGEVSTPTYGPGYLSSLSSIVVDSEGNFFISQMMYADCVFKFTPSGDKIVFGKENYPSFGFANDFGTSAMFYTPEGLAIDGSGNVYVADRNNRRIRKISRNGFVSTVAGSGDDGIVDGFGINAMFSSPYSIAVDAKGNIFVTDSLRIRQISPNGVVITLAGSNSMGYSDGIGTNAIFSYLNGITISNGNIFVADQGNSCIRKISFSPSLPGPLPVCDSTWHHIALTYTGSSSTNTLTAYIDGENVASITSTFAISSSPSSTLRIGWNGLSSSNSEFFSGSLSDLRIYNRSLLSSEILSISQPPLGQPFVLTDNPILQSKSTVYTWKCSPGSFGPTLTLSRAVSDGTWSTPTGSFSNCSACPVGSSSLPGSLVCTLCPTGSFAVSIGSKNCSQCSAGSYSASFGSTSSSTCVSCDAFKYSYSGSSSCSSCLTSSDFISSSQSCQPPIINSGPIDTSFYLSGSQEEGVGVFSSSLSNTSGITHFSKSTSFPSVGLILLNGSYLSTSSSSMSSLSSSLPIGSSSFTVSSWVKCSPFESDTTNPSSVISWGESRLSDMTSNNSVSLAVKNVILEATVTTIAGRGFGQFIDDGVTPSGFPGRIASDSLGNVYQCNDNRIRKIAPDGKVTFFAGNGIPGSDDGIGINATIYYCMGLTVDLSNNVYVLQSSAPIRKISPNGIVSTSTYSLPSGWGGGYGFYNYPTIDSFNNLYVSVTMSSHAVYKITPANDVIKFGRDGFEGGYADGIGTNAKFNYPQGLAIDTEGNVYVADSNNYRIRKISPSGFVSTIAGNGMSGYADGSGTDVMFSSPHSIAVDAKGNIFVQDYFYSYRIRQIKPNGVVTTLAGNSAIGYLDGIGTNAIFSYLSGITISNGNIFVSDSGNSCIRKISLSASLPGPLPVCDSTWHHIALTYTGSSSTNTLTAYIDGENVASITSTFAISSSPSSTLRIGWNGLSSSNSEFFSGSLSDLRIYNRSLLSSEILSISQPPLGQPFILTDNPILQSKSTVYTWKCSPGSFGPVVSLTRSSNDGTWSQSGGEVICQACPTNGYTYLSGRTACSFCPTTFSTIISSILGCRPSSIYYNGPIDTSFFLSGSKEEGIDAFFISNKALSSWFIDTLSFPSVALIFSSGLYMSMPIISSIPTGSNPFTISSWILCSPSSFSDINPSSVIISWGEAGSTPNVRTISNSGNGSYISTVPSVLTSATLSVTSLARRESPELVVSTFAGNSYSYTDGIGTSAAFRDPYGIAVDKWGSLYVTDYGNHRIRKISSSALVSTIAGGGTAAYIDGFGTSARFNNPIGVAVDGSSNLYIADSNNHCIRKITPSRVVTTIAGSGTTGQGSLLDETGTNARFNRPTGIAVDSFGTVAYIVDYGNNRVRKVILATGVVSTLTGNGAIGYLDNSADTSKVVSPPGIVLDPAGNLFIGDSYNNRIRKITPSGAISTYAGSTTFGLNDNMYPEGANFFSPGGVALDSSGNLYVADAWNQRIRKISPEGAVVTIAGSGNSGQDGGFENGVGTVAKFNRPYGIAVDTSGNVYIADSANNRIRKITITPRLPGPLPVCDSSWHHIALTYTGSFSTNTLTAYIDGSSVASTSATFIISSTSLSTLRIGWNGLSSPNSEFFSGSLSDLRIYNRSLSSSEILQISNRQSSNSPKLSSAYPPASPSVSPSAGTILVTASIVFNGASADSYSDIRTIADIALGLETAL